MFGYHYTPAGAGVQVALMVSAHLGAAGLQPFLQALAVLCLLAVPASFWPVVARLRRGQMRVLSRRLTQRAERAEAVAVAAQRWLDMAEQSAHVGYWQMTVPDNRLIGPTRCSGFMGYGGSIIRRGLRARWRRFTRWTASG